MMIQYRKYRAVHHQHAVTFIHLNEQILNTNKLINHLEDDCHQISLGGTEKQIISMTNEE